MSIPILMKRLALSALASSLLFVSCSSPTSTAGGTSATGGDAKASLTISLANNINSRTLTPTLDMNAASYTVTGTGPSGATFTTATTGASVTQNSLAFGTWTIVVNALNAAGTLIGTGNSTVQVNTGGTTSTTVSVTPVSGNGTLSLGISWPAAQVQSAAIAASLTPALGTAQNLNFAISGASATYSNTAVGNGYYTLAFTVQDTGIVVAGAVDVVRIITGQTTSGTYAFSQVNAPGGTINVGISTNMQNPLTVAIGGAAATQAAGYTKNLTASVSNYSGNVVYVWYVNGVSAGTGSSFTFGTGAKAGYSYRIDVTAFSADGTQAGSTSTTVNVVNATIPSAPTGVTASASNTTVSLGWASVNGAANYNVYRSTASGTQGSLLGTSTTASYTDTTAANGTTYYYTITAVNVAGESVGSTQASILTVPAAPTVVTGISTVNGSVGVSWVAVTGATSYNVYSGSTKIANVSQLLYLYNVGPYSGATLHVTALNASGESLPSSSVTVFNNSPY